jgi:hypothetical protein
MEKLKGEMTSAGRGEEFQKLKGSLTGEGPKVPYRQIALELRTTEEAVKTFRSPPAAEVSPAGDR